MESKTTKKTVIVTITKEIEVVMSSDMLTPYALAEFSEHFFTVEEPDEMFSNAAQQIARFEPNFIEGIGQCRPWWSKDPASVRYKEISEHFDTDILDGDSNGD